MNSLKTGKKENQKQLKMIIKQNIIYNSIQSNTWSTFTDICFSRQVLHAILDVVVFLVYAGALGYWAYREYNKSEDITMVTMFLATVTLVSVQVVLVIQSI